MMRSSLKQLSGLCNSQVQFGEISPSREATCERNGEIVGNQRKGMGTQLFKLLRQEDSLIYRDNIFLHPNLFSPSHCESQFTINETWDLVVGVLCLVIT